MGGWAAGTTDGLNALPCCSNSQAHLPKGVTPPLHVDPDVDALAPLQHLKLSALHHVELAGTQACAAAAAAWRALAQQRSRPEYSSCSPFTAALSVAWPPRRPSAHAWRSVTLRSKTRRGRATPSHALCVHLRQALRTGVSLLNEDLSCADGPFIHLLHPPRCGHPQREISCEWVVPVLWVQDMPAHPGLCAAHLHDPLL